ncbi:MAG TPA: PAS domain-containing sensor histidine kinase [Chitinophagaceae bacterium]|nr:PAS domain-containing sensor histidine kinase [Chitinophagaceae bacterium]
MNAVEKHRLLEALFEKVTESIVVCDTEGRIVIVNPAAEKLFGYSFEEIEGNRVEILIPDRFSKEHSAHRNHYSESPSPRAMGTGRDLFAIRKNGSEFPVEISLSPLRSGNEMYFIAFIIDITKRKEIEREVLEKQRALEKLTGELRIINEKLETKVDDRTKVLREALFELERSKNELSQALAQEKELNELKSRFLSMASHEFRTPLTAILSSASILEEYQGNESFEKKEKHLRRIKNAVHNLNDILSDFLSITKIEEGKVLAHLQPVALNEFCNEVVSDLKPLLKEGQQLQLHHQGPYEIRSDKKLLRNILINLVSNAIKFSPAGKHIQIFCEVGTENLSLKVSDEGMGISKEDQKHLFERFFRGGNAVNIQGTGLGLNIVANYVELLNGQIRFESVPGSGTTFIIELPLNRPE